MSLKQLTLGASLMLASIATAGPDWTEMGDAGKSTPQTVSIPVQPESISGTLGSPAPLRGVGDADGGEDIADVYDILITEDQEFIATTVTDQGLPFNNFDTALWLFRFDRRGLLANNDAGTTEIRSRILPIATDGTGARLSGPGRYLLAISYGNVQPLAGPTLQQIFNFANAPGPTQVSGPDGPGGSLPFQSFFPDGPQPIVEYRILIKPSPCPEPCFGDANGDLTVNFGDINAVLSVWGATCPP